MLFGGRGWQRMDMFCSLQALLLMLCICSDNDDEDFGCAYCIDQGFFSERWFLIKKKTMLFEENLLLHWLKKHSIHAIYKPGRIDRSPGSDQHN